MSDRSKVSTEATASRDSIPLQRLMMRSFETPIDAIVGFAADVRRGLESSPKQLPCKYFYDTRGSELFEQICRLEEYYLTRAERAVLEQRSDEIAALANPDTALVELGSGSAAKTRLLIEALLRRQERLHYIPVDISAEFLREYAGRLLQAYPALRITAFAGEYAEGLRFIAGEIRAPKLILWLGSSIGNLERSEAAAFLGQVRGLMRENDRLLVGIDLRKQAAVLERAYDDSAGVTAEFNKNLLRRINRELQADFDVDSFSHRAIYDEDTGRIEITLVANRAQSIRISRLGMTVALDSGEAIHTERCYKYSLPEIERLGDASGLSVERRWFDRRRRFSVNLFRPLPVPCLGLIQKQRSSHGPCEPSRNGGASTLATRA